MSETRPRKGKRRIERLLDALEFIYENEGTDVDRKLQAIRLAQTAMDSRTPPKRKTDKDKLLEQALSPKRKPSAVKPKVE